MKRIEVYQAIDTERAYQEKVWGDNGERRTNPETNQNSQHAVGNWMTFMEYYLRQAQDRLTTEHGHQGALDSLRKVAGLCVACFEQHGVPSRQ